MEKRNVVEAGRTPTATRKTAEVVDAGVDMFKAAATIRPTTVKAVPIKKEKAHAIG